MDFLRSRYRARDSLSSARRSVSETHLAPEASPRKTRTNVAIEELDHRPGEGVVLIACHHVGGAADVGDLRAGNATEELLHALLGDDVAEPAAHEKRRHPDIPHRHLEKRLELGT